MLGANYYGQRIVQGQAKHNPFRSRVEIGNLSEGRQLGSLPKNPFVGGLQLFSGFAARSVPGMDKQPYLTDLNIQGNVRSQNRLKGYGSKF